MQTIEQLKSNRLIWQGFQFQDEASVSRSGYSCLDEKIGGGFPRQGIIELRSAKGIGELRLLMPYLQSQQSHGKIVFIAPPSLLNAQSLAISQLALNNVLILTAQEHEALWCAEQCLKSGCCASVILWHQTFEMHQIRRLTLASEQGAATLFLLTAPAPLPVNLPVQLVLSLEPHQRGVLATVERQRAGRPTSPFVIDMQTLWPDLTLPILPENVVELNDFKSRAG